MDVSHVGDATTFNPAASGLPYSATNGTPVDPTVDYHLALRTASLKLRGNLPSLDEQQRLTQAVNSGNPADAQTAYEAMVRSYIYDSPVTFNRQMFHFWRNTLRMGGPAKLSALFSDSLTTTKTVDLDSAPAFASMLVAEDRDMRELFTRQTDTCPTFDQSAGTYAKSNCFIANGASQASPGNNVPQASQAGIITNPGLMAQFYSNFAFRRARILQEIFACTRYPAEFAKAPQQIGPYLYSAPWPVNSVTSAQNPATFDFAKRPRRQRGATTTTVTEFVDFKVECQNCHATLNHRAPMFGVFDQVGYRDMNNLLMVTSTATGSPFAQIQEYLYECNPTAQDGSANPVCAQKLAWRNEGKRFDFGGMGNVHDYPGFGAEMAADPQVAKCFMIRAWNYAYSRDDVVVELALVPDQVVADLTQYFIANNYNMKAALLKLYTSPNFIRF